MKRILVIGCPGSGKSYFSKRLGKILGLPVVHMDNLYWKKDKTSISHEELDGATLVLQVVTVGDRTLGCMLQCVGDEVRENLRQAVLVGIHDSRHIGTRPYKAERVGAAELENLLDALHQLIEVGGCLLDDNLA